MSDDSTLEALGKAIGETVVAAMRSSSVYISQRESPLGRNRHCAAVRRRLEELSEAERECTVVGRLYYLTPKGLRQEMDRALMRPPVKADPPKAPRDIDEEQAAYEAAGAALRRLRGA